MEPMMQDKKVCGCSHHKIVPGLMVLFGLLFLLEALGVWGGRFVSIAWPVLVVAARLIKNGEHKSNSS